jgi:hypothetical protein
MTEHDLKTWPEYFQAIVEGKKPFEYRLNDRDYQVGDVLHLREFVPPTDPENLQDVAYYTGRTLKRTVTYILDDKLGPTMKAGFVVMGLGDLSDLASAPASEWLDIKTLPQDGTRFVAHFIDFCDEYDENDRLIGRNVPTPGVTVAYSDPIFGFMEYPYNGKVFTNRRYTHWHALPALPVIS